MSTTVLSILLLEDPGYYRCYQVQVRLVDLKTGTFYQTELFDPKLTRYFLHFAGGGAERQCHCGRAGPRLGFGRIVASDREAPNMLAIPV